MQPALPDLHRDLEFDFGGFHNLMPNRVHNILLVSSLYESFILEEDGLISEMITSEFVDMKLSHAPRVARVSTGEQALSFVRQNPVDLVITMTRLGNLNVSELAKSVKEINPDLPVVVLADNARELVRNPGLRDRSCIDRVFVWHGDAKILLTIVKLIEDQLNVEHDTRVGDVRVIILVENSVRFYSTYLPLFYTELLKLTQSLMAEGINLMQRLLRMRARPKILLAETFEEAWQLYSKYSENVLGVITDIRFPRNGRLDPEAGLEFTRLIKDKSPDTPVLLQSSDGAHAESAEHLNAGFVNKKSPTLLEDLRSFLLGSLGFGDFVFTLPDGTVIGRAHDLRSFEAMVKKTPDDSLAFHALHNHFSNWFMARTEFELATRIRPKKVTDFATADEMRQYLLNTIAEFRERSQSGVISDFSARIFDATSSFARIGGGSMGGKGRGLAFINALVRRYNLNQRFDNVHIVVPTSATLGTDVFDTFMDKNKLRSLAAKHVDDKEIARAFLKAKIPKAIHKKLSAFLEQARYPLAVRSSSLLEDSQDEPFAGVYATHMIPNNHANLKIRREQLCDAIKLVYASMFFRGALHYLEATSHHAQEEKMAVILQEIVGSPHGTRFYPTFSGVARSYNYYPIAKMKPEDGVAYVALGLGKIVVEGGGGLMFSPAHPNTLPQFATTKDMLDNSQRFFYAVDISRPNVYPTPDANANIAEFGLDVAEHDGTLAPIGSVYSPDNDAVYDGLSRPGTRLVTFAHVLKANIFPLAEILQTVLDIGRDGMGCPVEIEYAVDMSSDPMVFGLLQIRPSVYDEECPQIEFDHFDRSQTLCMSDQVLGNGRICGMYDIIYVKPDDFDSAHTVEIAHDIGLINETIRKAGRRCVLIGPGRWGSADRWLGIPVTWDQISCAQVIVEAALEDFVVTPSQGTHFFQNLTSLRVGYFTVNPIAGQGYIDWDWLADQPAVSESRFLRHVHLDESLDAVLDGKTRQGLILKPGAREAG
ncbi:MAG: histidine kinase [Planctomycetota bacterium]|nr:histidine kinase [Planctomycetota bacterium]